MDQILLILIKLIAFTCAMRFWAFNFPPRIFIFDVLSLSFCALFFIYYCVGKKHFTLNKVLRVFLSLLWVFWGIKVISGLKILDGGSLPEGYVQYYRGILSGLAHLVFFTFFTLYFASIRAGNRRKVLHFYIAGVIASCMYGVLQIVVRTRYHINIDSYIWDQISYHANVDFNAPITWSVMGIPRGIGFAGVNASATYVVTALPLLLLWVGKASNLREKIGNILMAIIALSGFLVIMSRTGFLAFVVALFMLFLFERKRIAGIVLIVFSPFVIFGIWKWRVLSEIIKYRDEIDMSRIRLFESGFYLFSQNPFLGLGVNNFSVSHALLPYGYEFDWNLHNSWLSILVELGLLGFLCKMLFIGYVILTSLRVKSPLSIAFVCSVVGLSIGALTNQVFDLFYFNFYIVLVFGVIVLDRESPVQKGLHYPVGSCLSAQLK